jgi:hypothetical protein
MHRHELAVDVLSESVGGLFLLAIQRSEIGFAKWGDGNMLSYPL